MINRILGLFGYELVKKKGKKLRSTRFASGGRPTKAFVSRKFKIPYGDVCYIMCDAYYQNNNLTRDELLNIQREEFYRRNRINPTTT